MLKVLIAEDELLIADLLEEALVANGYEVCGIARTVDEAVALEALNILEHADLIQSRRGTIVILDRVGLKKSSDGTYRKEPQASLLGTAWPHLTGVRLTQVGFAPSRLLEYGSVHLGDRRLLVSPKS